MKNNVAVLYSKSQNCFHNETIRDYIKHNVKCLVNNEPINYHMVGCASDYEEANALIEKLRESEQYKMIDQKYKISKITGGKPLVDQEFKIAAVLEWAESQPKFDASFVYDLQDKYQEYGSLTDAQEEALDNIIDKWKIPI